MLNNKKISLCMVVYNYPELIKTAIQSVRSVVDEVVIVDQGSAEVFANEISKMADVYIKTTNKGNADYDRQYCYSLASHEFILALDSDEFLEEQELAKFEQIFKYEFDACWFLFHNELVHKERTVDLRELLGEDPHPRLWRKVLPTGQPVLEWPYQAHKFPLIHSQRQIFSEIRFKHRRDLTKVVQTHISRSQNIDQEGAQLEKRFIHTILTKFGEDVIKEMKSKFLELSNYLKD